MKAFCPHCQKEIATLQTKGLSAPNVDSSHGKKSKYGVSNCEYKTLITSVINRHKDCPWDKTGTYCGKYARKC